MKFFNLFKKKCCQSNPAPFHPNCKCSGKLVEIHPEVISLDAAALKEVLTVRCRRKKGETSDTYARRLENKIVELKESLRKAVVV